MKAYWSNLNERERWMVGLAALCCFFYLFYLLLYSPLANAVHIRSQQLIEKQETLVWMRQQAPLSNKAHHTQETLTSGQLLTQFSNQLHNTSFQQFPYQLQQTGAGDIQLSFDQVPFNLFIGWLWSINEKYAISIKQLNTERTDSPGIVKLLVVVAAK